MSYVKYFFLICCLFVLEGCYVPSNNSSTSSSLRGGEEPVEESPYEDYPDGWVDYLDTQNGEWAYTGHSPWGTFVVFKFNDNVRGVIYLKTQNVYKDVYVRGGENTLLGKAKKINLGVGYRGSRGQTYKFDFRGFSFEIAGR